MIFNQQIAEKLNYLNNLQDSEFQDILASEIETILEVEQQSFDKDSFYQYILSLDQQEHQLNQTFKKLKFSQSKTKILLEILKQSRFQIELFQNQQNIQVDEIERLDSIQWRYDIQTSSKYFNNQCIPKIYLKIRSNNEILKKTKEETMECDYGSLENLEENISDALQMSEIRE